MQIEIFSTPHVVSFTVRIAGVELLDPPALVHTALNCLPSSASDTVKLIEAVVAPVLSCQLAPLSALICHCTVLDTSLVAAVVKVTVVPSHFVCVAGCKVMAGGMLKASGAAGGSG